MHNATEADEPSLALETRALAEALGRFIRPRAGHAMETGSYPQGASVSELKNLFEDGLHPRVAAATHG